MTRIRTRVLKIYPHRNNGAQNTYSANATEPFFQDSAERNGFHLDHPEAVNYVLLQTTSPVYKQCSINNKQQNS